MTKPGLRDWADGHDLIVLDGCDGAGKTTLAAALANRHGHSTRARHPHPGGDRPIREIPRNPGPRRDRRCWTAASSANWSTARSIAATPGSPSSRQHISPPIAAQRGGILVHLTGQPDQIAARLLARDGHAPSLPRISALTSAYADVFTRLADHAPVITIDTTAAEA